MSQYIIVVNRKLPIADVITEINTLGIAVIKQHAQLDHTFVVDSTMDVINQITGLLAADPQEAVVTMHWHKERIVTKALPLRTTYDPTFSGVGRTVYVVDSGIDDTHSEFANTGITNLFSVTGSYADSTGHGTAMASVIAGATLGVSPDANIKVVKITDPAHSTTLGDIIDALDAVLVDHMITPIDTKVINMSWTIPKSEVLDLKVIELLNKNIVVCCAAGNEGVAVDTLSPAGINHVLTVGASDEFDRAPDYSSITTGIPNGASSPNYGAEIDIFAPGVDVNIATTSNTIDLASGTSIASAIVAGMACQYITKEPNSDSDFIQSEIIANGNKGLLYISDANVNSTVQNNIAFTHTPFYDEIWSTGAGRLANYKTSSSNQVFTLEYANTVTSISASAATPLPPYITMMGSSLVIKTNDITKTEPFILTFSLDAHVGEYAYPRIFSIGFYITDEDELNGDTTSEVYFTEVDPNTGEPQYIVVTPAIIIGK